MTRFGSVLLAALLVTACQAEEVSVTTTSSTTTTVAPTTTTTSTSTTTTTTTTTMPPPAIPERYVAPENEVAREAKQLATDIILDLITYEADDPVYPRYLSIAGEDGVVELASAAASLTVAGYWSRGEIIYPQLGGLTNSKVSLMVVTRQSVGTGPDPEFTVVRTIDLRLVMGDEGWEFDFLASAGGVFESIEALELAHAVTSDQRIEMSHSARLDILNGGTSPALLELMLELADITPYGVTVLSTGHPYHVFQTNRVSHHSVGRAMDIHRFGDNLVIDDRARDSFTREIVSWLYRHPDVVQVGAPWDIDGGGSKKSFANTVHQDHVHVAVVG